MSSFIRQSSSSGLCSFVVGLLGISLLLAALQPSHDWLSYVGMPMSECPNYGGNGNAGPFAYSDWGLVLGLSSALWVLVVITEQLLVCVWSTRALLPSIGRSGLVLGATIFFAWQVLGIAFACS
jgi:hypothetical protein